ncbi:MAG: hypothetical protein AMJ60_01975 [Desulfobacterales bacterium SG8_35]|nr:MAG: hypothetical protein AMJ60_01975 [Desulfobacterales bacterium SG8_35]
MEKQEYDPADTDCVVSAANYLEVSEFAVFMDAYTAWYGKEASEKQVEKIFVQYLQENKVPFWVRNYARSRVHEESITSQAHEDSRIANNFLYLASIIAEYVLLGCYLVMR